MYIYIEASVCILDIVYDPIQLFLTHHPCRYVSIPTLQSCWSEVSAVSMILHCRIQAFAESCVPMLPIRMCTYPLPTSFQKQALIGLIIGHRRQLTDKVYRLAYSAVHRDRSASSSGKEIVSTSLGHANTVLPTSLYLLPHAR